MIRCNHCNSENTTKNGAIMRGREKYARIKCNDCGEVTHLPYDMIVDIDESEYEVEAISYIRDDKYISQLQDSKVLVVTCAVQGHEVNDKFLKALEVYVKSKKGKLAIIPIKYRNNDIIPVVDTPAEKYYVQNNFNYGNDFKIMGALKLNAAMEHPLAGLDPLSKGKSVLFGHPQVALKTVATDNVRASIMSTTGCVTEKLYTDTKQGLKANFNHSHSAVVLEKDGDITHIRHLNFDGNGFYDLDTYTDSEIQAGNFKLAAIVTGDEHVLFQDKDVVNATYNNKNSIVKTLKPDLIVRHDVLDCYSVSHHHKHNVFTQFAKYKQGISKLQDELNTTLKFIADTTPSGSESLIVPSNHNDHLFRWLNECDPKVEPWNAEVYHWLMYSMLKKTRMGEAGAEYPNPFELYAEQFNIPGIKFLERNEPFMIHDVSVNCHGDIGTNGSRGSRRAFSNLPTKHVIGHSHSPGIEKGVYQVGTSSKLRLEYNNGPSSWAHCHCLIYPNGKRQLVFIQDGKWRK